MESIYAAAVEGVGFQDLQQRLTGLNTNRQISDASRVEGLAPNEVLAQRREILKKPVHFPVGHPKHLTSDQESLLRRFGDIPIALTRGILSVPEAVVGLGDIASGGKVGNILSNLGVDFTEQKEWWDQ